MEVYIPIIYVFLSLITVLLNLNPLLEIILFITPLILIRNIDNTYVGFLSSLIYVLFKSFFLYIFFKKPIPILEFLIFPIYSIIIPTIIISLSKEMNYLKLFMLFFLLFVSISSFYIFYNISLKESQKIYFNEIIERIILELRKFFNISF